MKKISLKSKITKSDLHTFVLILSILFHLYTLIIPLLYLTFGLFLFILLTTHFYYLYWLVICCFGLPLSEFRFGKFFGKFEDDVGFLEFFLVGSGEFLAGEEVKEVEGGDVGKVELVGLLEEGVGIFHKNYKKIGEWGMCSLLNKIINFRPFIIRTFRGPSGFLQPLFLVSNIFLTRS